MSEIGMQLHVSPVQALAEGIAPVVNDLEMYFRQKPKGGLWTSSWRAATQDSDWVAWCRSEQFGSIDEKQWHLLTPRPTSRIYTIDSLADFERCLRDYGHPARIAELDLIFAGKRVLDFEQLAQDYDGVHLTEHGSRVTHLSYPNDLNSWDCESTLWFRWCFTDVQRIETPKLSEEIEA